MPVRSRLAALSLGALGTTVFLAFSACDLDWTTRLDPIGTPNEGGNPDQQTTDADSNREGGDTDADTGAPDAKIDAATCEALRAEVALKKKQARKCTVIGVTQCQQTVKDACNCDVVVENPSPDPDTASFVTASQMLQASGCPAQCTTCITQTSRQCLQQADGDGGTELVCVQN